MQKHGIDFLEAQLLWADGERVAIPAKTEDEERSIVTGRIGDKHWSAVKTCRSGKTRIISGRRAQREEIHIYES